MEYREAWTSLSGSISHSAICKLFACYLQTIPLPPGTLHVNEFKQLKFKDSPSTRRLKLQR